MSAATALVIDGPAAGQMVTSTRETFVTPVARSRREQSYPSSMLDTVTYGVIRFLIGDLTVLLWSTTPSSHPDPTEVMRALLLAGDVRACIRRDSRGVFTSVDR